MAIGAILVLRNRLSRSRAGTVLTALVGAYLGSCWVSLVLAWASMVAAPGILRVPFVPLAVLTAICLVLSSATRTPGILQVLAQRGPEAEAARVMFPLAFVIPLALAILRYQAESFGWLQRDLGLLLHVLMSAGSMVTMIVWNANRIQAAKRIRASTDVATEALEVQYRDIFAVLRDPVARGGPIHRM